MLHVCRSKKIHEHFSDSLTADHDREVGFVYPVSTSPCMFFEGWEILLTFLRRLKGLFSQGRLCASKENLSRFYFDS